MEANCTRRSNRSGKNQTRRQVFIAYQSRNFLAVMDVSATCCVIISWLEANITPDVFLCQIMIENIDGEVMVNGLKLRGV
jgi:hypothetical protein